MKKNNGNKNDKNKKNKLRNWIFVILGCIVLVCVLSLYLILNFDFEFSKKSVEKELTKEELKELEVEKLRAALIEDGYIERDNGIFEKVLASKYNEDGTPFHTNSFSFHLNDLSYNQIAFTIDISTIYSYSFFTNVATGTTTFFDSKVNGKVTDVWKSSYDFNSGMGTCTSAVGYSCNANNLVDFKTSITGFMASNKIDIELLKEV